MKRQFLISLIAILLFPVVVEADDWNYVTTSGEYYYGMGHGENEEEAMKVALAELTSMIVTYVSSEFTGLMDETNVNGQIDHKSQVQNCVKTYSQATLRNVEKWTEKQGSGFFARCYMKRSELENIYQERIAKSKDMLRIAGQALDKGKVDMALQYYYWSYSLIRSLQRPNEVTDSEGRVLVNWIPVIIEAILSNVDVSFDQREENEVDLLFNYKGKPVSCLDFTYNDGRSFSNYGTAKDGRGMLEMIPNYETRTYHLNIEYEYKGQARGDQELNSILDVVPKKYFKNAEIVVVAKDEKVQKKKEEADDTGVSLKPAKSQLAPNTEKQGEVVQGVIDAIQQKHYSEANSYFTLEGLEMFNKLITYGTGRVVGTPHIQFFKSANGKTVARGLQMAFSFNKGTKKSFVEDVVFTLNHENKIESVAFGLGQVAENDILCKHPDWSDATRELIMEFMESYKTAYCLQRIDYIRDIFADDAVIIIGNVTNRRSPQMTDTNQSFSEEGKEIIKYNRYTKDEYLKNLERCFRRNDFVNIRFSSNDIQWLEKFRNDPEKKELFAIQIGQEYNSTTYGDKGYLFLLVNLTDHNNPQIQIRTWQPNEIDMSKIYNVGDFIRN